MQDTRRPVLLIAIASWLMAGWWLTRSYIWLAPLGLLVIWRERRLWLMGLVMLRLLMWPAGEMGSFLGPADVRPVDFSRPDTWQVTINQQSFLYQGKLETAGRYHIRGERKPFLTKRCYNGYSEHDYHHAQGFLGRLEIESAELLHARPAGLVFRWQQALYHHLAGFGRQRELTYGLLFGGHRLMDEALQQSLRRLGLLHLMVVSGLHLQIYQRAIDWILRRLWFPRLIRQGLIFVIMLGLLIITNGHASCLRAIGLHICREVAFYRRRSIDKLDQLALVSWLMLLINPYWATSTGWLLGSLAHASLALPAKPSLIRLHLVMLPFQLLLNGLVSPLFLLTNIALAAIMSKALPLLALCLIVPVCQPVGAIWLSGLIRLLERVAACRVLRLEVVMPAPGFIGLVLLFYIGLMLTRNLAIARHWVMRHYPKVLAGLLIMIGLAQAYHFDRQRGIHFLDVAQGDAIVIITSAGRSILIDTSRSERLFDHLRYLGIRRLDGLIITHRDHDHAAWIDRLDFITGYTSRYTPINGFLSLEQGDRLVWDEVTIEVLHPDKDYADENDNSLVLRVEMEPASFILAGDVSQRCLRPDWFGITGYKFPHHGALSSLCPDMAAQRDVGLVILSYGKNRYQHPHPAVLDFFKHQMIHETFFDGSIHLRGTRYRYH